MEDVPQAGPPSVRDGTFDTLFSLRHDGCDRLDVDAQGNVYIERVSNCLKAVWVNIRELFGRSKGDKAKQAFRVFFEGKRFDGGYASIRDMMTDLRGRLEGGRALSDEDLLDIKQQVALLLRLKAVVEVSGIFSCLSGTGEFNEFNTRVTEIRNMLFQVMYKKNPTPSFLEFADDDIIMEETINLRCAALAREGDSIPDFDSARPLRITEIPPNAILIHDPKRGARSRIAREESISRWKSLCGSIRNFVCTWLTGSSLRHSAFSVENKMPVLENIDDAWNGCGRFVAGVGGDKSYVHGVSAFARHRLYGWRVFYLNPESVPGGLASNVQQVFHDNLQLKTGCCSKRVVGGLLNPSKCPEMEYQQYCINKLQELKDSNRCVSCSGGLALVLGALNVDLAEGRKAPEHLTSYDLSRSHLVTTDPYHRARLAQEQQ